MGILRGSDLIRSGDDLRIAGIVPAGIAVAGAVLYRQRGEVEPPVTGPQPFITAVTPAALDTTHTGLSGMQFIVGATPLVISALGLWIIPQNTAPTTLYLSDPNWAIPASPVINPVGLPQGQFAYADIAPVRVPAGSTYFIWISGAAAMLDASPVVTTSAAQAWAAVGMTPELANHSYGPVNFKYELG